MATRRDPRFKECRRFGVNVYGHPKALKRVRKDQRQKKMSEYGTQLLEKQKLRAYYNLLERQFVRYYDKAKKMEGVTGQNMLKLLECRLEEPEPMIRIRVVCSKGTYIRALARDIGEALHSGAHLTGLIRTRVGDVRLEDCLDPALFKEWIDGQEIENDEENN